MLDVAKDTQKDQVIANLKASGTTLSGKELEEVANLALKEYDLNIKGVKSTFNHFIYEYETTGKAQGEVANDLGRILRIRFKSNAPRRPPRVVILGPPASGRQSQSEAVA